MTNGICWEVYRIKFERPITHEEVCKFNMLEVSPRKADDQDLLYILCREGLAKAAMEEYHERIQLVNRFIIGSLIQTEPVMAVVRRELRRLGPDLKVSVKELQALLPDVLKRDVIDGPQADEAASRVKRAASKALRKKARRTAAGVPGSE